MKWEIRNKPYDYGNHRGHYWFAHYHDSFFSKIKRFRYCFEYDLDDTVEFDENDEIVISSLLLNGNPFFNWLVENQSGKIRVKVEYATHMGRSILNKFNPSTSLYCTSLKIEFSCPDLAIRWKLTWGGSLRNSVNLSFD